MQLEKINPKMSFWKAKQGLSKTWDLKTKIDLILGRRTNREGGKEEKRKRKKKKRIREGEMTDPLPSDRKSAGNSTVTPQPSSLD